jgi:hypothetical protein
MNLSTADLRNSHFLYRVLAANLKMADISKIWKRRIAPLMVTYHYVKFYVSIIIQLEVIIIFSFSFLSVHHELVHSRSQELQDRISWNNLVEL